MLSSTHENVDLGVMKCHAKDSNLIFSECASIFAICYWDSTFLFSLSSSFVDELRVWKIIISFKISSLMEFRSYLKESNSFLNSFFMFSNGFSNLDNWNSISSLSSGLKEIFRGLVGV